jgi:hypothetical protein
MIHPIAIIQMGEVCSLMLVDIGVEASINNRTYADALNVWWKCPFYYYE